MLVQPCSFDVSLRGATSSGLVFFWLFGELFALEKSQDPGSLASVHHPNLLERWCRLSVGWTEKQTSPKQLS